MTCLFKYQSPLDDQHYFHAFDTTKIYIPVTSLPIYIITPSPLVCSMMSFGTISSWQDEDSSAFHLNQIKLGQVATLQATQLCKMPAFNTHCPSTKPLCNGTS